MKHIKIDCISILTTLKQLFKPCIACRVNFDLINKGIIDIIDIINIIDFIIDIIEIIDVIDIIEILLLIFVTFIMNK